MVHILVRMQYIHKSCFLCTEDELCHEKHLICDTELCQSASVLFCVCIFRLGKWKWRTHSLTTPPFTFSGFTSKPDTRSFTPWMRHFCGQAVQFTQTHALQICSCAQSNSCNRQYGGCEVWGVRPSRTFKGHPRTGCFLDEGLNLGPISPILLSHLLFLMLSLLPFLFLLTKNSKWLLSGSRHAYWT